MKLIVAMLLFYLAVRTMRLFVERQVIRNAQGDAYLVRYFVFRSRLLERCGLNIGRVYLHHILRSDHDRALHDHPWNFVSIILRGGYYEHSDPRQRLSQLRGQFEDGTAFRWYGVADVLCRGAGWRHRLRLPEGHTAWTLVFTTRKLREWGFWIGGERFCHWKTYDTTTGQCDDA
jgi:hypothetical protein